MVSKKLVITKEREVRTYAEMWHTSGFLLKKGVENKTGSYLMFMASLVFTAFTLEAYLNHIGPKLFKCWGDLERLGPREKLNIVLDRLNITVNNGKRPWQVMKRLFSFRNDIAHGKSEVVKMRDKVSLNMYSERKLEDVILTKWEEYCTKSNAQKAREDIEKIVITIHEAGNFDDYPFVFGLESGSETVIEE
jgi:hypothetical protein